MRLKIFLSVIVILAQVLGGGAAWSVLSGTSDHMPLMVAETTSPSAQTPQGEVTERGLPVPFPPHSGPAVPPRPLPGLPGPSGLPPAPPDLVVDNIMLTRNPGYEAGRLMIYFRDSLGRDHFRSYFDTVQESRRRAGQPTNDESIYPFEYRVYVDGARIPTASVPADLPRSGRREMVTEGYWLPGDGRPHQVRVVASPINGDRNTGNNELTRELRADPFTVPKFAALIWATGAPFDVSVPSPLRNFIPLDRGILVVPPEYRTNGFFTVPTTRGRVGSDACVNSRGLTVLVRGTVGNIQLRSVSLVVIGGDTVLSRENTLRGRTRVDDVWHEAGAPYETLDQGFTVDLQPMVSGYSRTLTVRVTATDVTGRGHTYPDIQFSLAGYEFLPSGNRVGLTVDEVGNRVTHRWSSASRGATNITIRSEEHLTLNGYINLSSLNCALRNVRVEEIHLLKRVSDTGNYFSGCCNVYRHSINREGFSTTFRADFNVRNLEPEDPGTYELELSIRFSGITWVFGGRITFRPWTPMIITVTE